MALELDSASAVDRPAQLPLSRSDLLLLDAVGQCGDLTEVARSVGLRHGAVERQLDRLDRSTGLLLTLRSRHTARLSSAGSRMLAAGRRFFRQVDLAVQADILGHGGEALEAPGVLGIATAEPLPEDLVEDAAATLGVLLSVTHESPQQVLRRLSGYRVDAAHTWGFDAPHTWVDRSVRMYEVLDDPLWVTLPVGHRLAARPVVSLADLLDDSWVSETGPNAQVVVSRVFRTAGLPVPERLQVTSASVARGMLRRGDAVGLGSPACPAVLAPSLVRRPVLERPRRVTGLLVDPAVVPRTLAEQLAVMLAGRYLDRFAEHYRDLLHDRWWEEWYREQTAARKRRSAALAQGPASRPTSAEPPSGTLDVEDLQVLRAVARHGSINRAATVLSISQSALTRRIHRLERRLNARLLLRSSRGTDLTGPTRQFLARLNELETDLHDAGAACRSLNLPASPGPWSYRTETTAAARSRRAGEAG